MDGEGDAHRASSMCRTASARIGAKNAPLVGCAIESVEMIGSCARLPDAGGGFRCHQSVGDSDIDRGCAGAPSRVSGANKCFAAGGDVVDQYDRPALHDCGGQLGDDDLTVPGSGLRQADGVAIETARPPLRPGRRFRIRSNDQWPRLVPGKSAGERFDRREVARRRAERPGEVVGSVQVRLHRDHAVEPGADQRADDVAAQGLARLEDRVLPQVAEIGRHQDQPPRAGASPGVGGQQEVDELLVGMIERAVDHGDVGGGRGDARHRLAVRKAVRRHRPQRRAQGGRQPAGLRHLIWKACDRQAHRPGATMKPDASPAASTAKPKSDGSSP